MRRGGSLLTKVAPIFSVIVGIYWIIKGKSYGIWVKNGPGGGLFPILAGIILIICGVIASYKEFKSESSSKFNIKAFLPIAFVLLILIFSYVVGLILAIGTCIFFWLKFYEKFSIKYSFLVSLCTIATIYLVFDYWLKVPIPLGMLGSFFIIR